MNPGLESSRATSSPPLEKGRSASVASRVGIKASRFDLTRAKTARARRLRRNSTDVEMDLWQKLRNRQLGVDFRRQHPIGNYVLDFYCPVLRLAIELDGGQHAGIGAARRDDKRTHWLVTRGISTLRFWNSDVVRNIDGVLEAITDKNSQLRSAQKQTPTRRA